MLVAIRLRRTSLRYLPTLKVECKKKARAGGQKSLSLRTKKKRRPGPGTASTFLGRKCEFKLGCLLADLCFGALQKHGNMSDTTPMFDPVAKREQILLGPFFTGV
jgi:hypothetical protein